MVFRGSFCNVYLNQLLIHHFHGDGTSSKNHPLLHCLNGGGVKEKMQRGCKMGLINNRREKSSWTSKKCMTHSEILNS